MHDIEYLSSGQIGIDLQIFAVQKLFFVLWLWEFSFGRLIVVCCSYFGDGLGYASQERPKDNKNDFAFAIESKDNIFVCKFTIFFSLNSFEWIEIGMD